MPPLLSIAIDVFLAELLACHTLLPNWLSTVEDPNIGRCRPHQGFLRVPVSMMAHIELLDVYLRKHRL